MEYVHELALNFVVAKANELGFNAEGAEVITDGFSDNAFMVALPDKTNKGEAHDDWLGDWRLTRALRKDFPVEFQSIAASPSGGAFTSLDRLEKTGEAHEHGYIFTLAPQGGGGSIRRKKT